MTQVRFRIRRDEAANWTSVNPTLALGEPGLETDTRRVKYGDGTSAWTSLAYSGETFSASITALAGLTPDADRLPYFTSASAAALATLTSYARTLLDDADAVTARGTLGLGSIATQAANSVAITGGSATGLTSVGIGTSSPATALVVSNGGAQGVEVDPGGGFITSYNRTAGDWSPLILRMSHLTLNIGGVFAALTVRAGGIIGVGNAPTYADDAAAGSAGLATGDLYKTSDGAGGFFLKIKA